MLRQPYIEKTPFDELNESYVFCLRRRASDITREVKKALEQEGYEGDAMSVVENPFGDGHAAERIVQILAGELHLPTRKESKQSFIQVSGHGLMHAPITALLVEALLTGDAEGGKVRLPEPFAEHTLNLSAFDPARTFSESGKERMVL